MAARRQFLDRRRKLLGGRADLLGGRCGRRSSAKLLSQRRQRARGCLSLIERLGLLLNRRLRFARAGRLLLGRARDLLRAFLRFGRRPFGFEGRVQHLLAPLRNSPHVLPAIFEGLHDCGRSLRFRRGRLSRFLHRADDAADIDLNFACQSFDLLGALVGRLGQRANLVGDDRKASPVIAGARRLDRGVQGQETGLVRDAADRLRDLADIPRATLQFRDDLDRRALPLRVALDRPSGGGDPLRRVAEHDLHGLRAPA